MVPTARDVAALAGIPDRVVSRTHPAARVVDDVLSAELPPASWSMLLVQVRTPGTAT